MELNDRAMKALLDAFDRSDWREMTVAVGGDTLHVSRGGGDGAGPPAPAAPAAAAPSAPAPAPAAPPEAAPAPPAADGAQAAAPDPPPAAPAPAPAPAEAADGTGTVVSSPSVGLFWRAPAPGAPPFVEVGGRVEAGDTVAIVEVMKLMSHVPAPVAGLVTSIVVENGETVEYGQPLITIDPEG
jgi:acetyl-CoA carboxylase biotin carboxyl carrier protein